VRGRRGGGPVAFRFHPSDSAIWIVSGVVHPGAAVNSDRIIDGTPVYQAGDPLGALLIGTYGADTANGSVFSVRWLWSGEIIGRAGGGGYDRRGTALADALTYLYGVPPFDGGAGEPAVIDHAARHGVTVATGSEVAWQRARSSGNGGAQ